MIVKFQQFDKEKLLIQKYSGKWSIEDFKAYIDMNLSIIEWKNVEKVLTDFRDLEDEKIIDSLDELVKIREHKLPKETKNITLANKPIATAFLTLYSHEQQKREHNYEVCSTIEYAISSLNLGLNSTELENMISDLEYVYKK